MSISRRRLLTGAAALALAGVTGARAAAAKTKAPKTKAAEPPILRAAPGSVRLAPPDYPETPIWGYDGQVPGPVLRVAQGERLTRRFVNELPQPSTIHWHGVRIANPMDGVPELTQAPVPPGGDFLYDFAAPDAGTWWYHPHHRTWEQMARGLYGALIVEEPAPPRADRDEVLLIDDWRLTGDAGIHESFGAMMDLSHAGRIGNWVTVNGAGELRLPVKRRERLRLRLVNTANARIFTLGLAGMEGWIVALDGQPLDAPAPIPAPDGRIGPSPSLPRNAPICSWTSPPGTARGRRSFRSSASATAPSPRWRSGARPARRGCRRRRRCRPILFLRSGVSRMRGRRCCAWRAEPWAGCARRCWTGGCWRSAIW